MQDPCDPTPHHAAVVVHHHHPAQVIGRIRRHGTHRIARRLHGLSAACPAGPPIVIGFATMKAILPAAAFVGLTTLASSARAPTVENSDGPYFGPGGSPAGFGVAPHKHSHHHHPPVNVPEPPSLALLLLVIVGWIGLRVGLGRLRRQP
jgi:hypothetical protein